MLEYVIRPEQTADVDSIGGLITRAFANHPHSDRSEARIVAALRTAGALTLSFVAIEDAAIVGHVAFSPVTLSDGTREWYGLAPVSVEPACWRRGFGSALVRSGLAALAQRGAAGCVVFGDPAYYRRFGFRACEGLVHRGGPPALFQALAFRGVIPQAVVEYHRAFGNSAEPA